MEKKQQDTDYISTITAWSHEHHLEGSWLIVVYIKNTKTFFVQYYICKKKALLEQIHFNGVFNVFEVQQCFM